MRIKALYTCVKRGDVKRGDDLKYSNNSGFQLKTPQQQSKSLALTRFFSALFRLYNPFPHGII
jgi:hypothetical protein